MSAIEVHGLCQMKGEIEVQGSKNASLPMMAAAILNRGITIIDNIPRIQDVFCMMGILDSLGCQCSLTGHRLVIDATTLTGFCVPEEEMKKMRSSIMLLGALLGREGKAQVSNPGGCMIGKRPIDLHLMALKKLGATISEADGYVKGEASSLKGTTITFPFPSVGATENALFAAVAAHGHSELIGCAREPEIENLCHFMVNMGACIKGIGTNHLIIEGGLPLHDSEFRVDGDRIVAGTYLMAAAGTRSEILVKGAKSAGLKRTADALRQMGASVYEEEDLIYIKAQEQLTAISITTGPYPEFPTDLQSMMMSVMSLSNGIGVIEEKVFENRFKAAEELKKMGADITILDNCASIRGRRKIYGASVTATDLRGGAALVIAGLSAEGITKILDCRHIMRGYEDICRDLKSLGADIHYC